MKKITTTIALAFCLQTNAQIITTVAGNGTATYNGDNINATAASLNSPFGVAIDGVGNLYITDTGNQRIRKVTPTGTITTVAGNGVSGYWGDGGQATAAQINNPEDVAFDAAGNMYITDVNYAVVRKISTAGIITTVAGNGTQGYSGDNAAATAAQLKYPTGLAIDAAGNFYIADYTNNVIRKVTPAGIISTVAGNGVQGYSGDNGMATVAQLYAPRKVAIDATGNLYIADAGNNVIRKVNTAGVITTFAGNGTAAYSGDNGQATSATLNYPAALTIDATNNLYIADDGNHVIRKVTQGGIITTFAGNGIPSYSGDGGQAIAAAMQNPGGLALDSYGNLYIADYWDNRVRQVSNLTVNSAAFCAGSPAPNLIAQGAVSYTWSPSNGLNTTTGNTVVANPTVTTTYTVLGTVVFNTNPIAVITTVTVNPLPVINVNSGSICTGQSFTISPTGAGSFTYSSGSPVVTPTVTTTYSVTGNSSGCASTNISTVTVNPLPVASITAGGATTFCQGDNVTLSANTANTYSWSNGASAQSITVSASGNYSVSITDVNGCSGSSSVTGVTVNPLPVASITPNGATTFCHGDNVTLGANAANAYLWSNGASTQSITVSASGNYSVSITDMNGCSGNSSVTGVTVNPLPAVPIISASGAVLSSNDVVGNQWYLNGSLIPGATSQFYTTTQNGFYTVSVADINGCTSTSVPFNYNSTGITAFTNNFPITVYPNPSNGNFTIQSSISGNGLTEVQLTDLVGKQVFYQAIEMTAAGAPITINADNVANGVYILILKTGNANSYQKIVIEK